MSIPGWFREETEKINSVYSELSQSYPKSVKYIQEEDFWVLNNELNEIMSKSSLFNNKKRKETAGLMQQKLKHLAKKLIEDGYDLKPGTFEAWFEMLCRKLEEKTNSSPDIQNIISILAYARGQR